VGFVSPTRKEDIANFSSFEIGDALNPIRNRFARNLLKV
jgi:hypothetical protein